MIQEIPTSEPKIGVSIATKTAEIIGQLSRVELSEPTQHPWEVYLASLPKKERGVSRMACEPLPEIPIEELLRKLKEATLKVLSQSEEGVFINNNPKKINETMASNQVYIFPELSSEEEIIHSITSTEDFCWMGIGIIEKKGEKFLFSSGDHLATDGNTFMKIFSQIQQELRGNSHQKIEKNIQYRDGNKNIFTHSFSSEQKILYQELYERVLRVISKEIHKEKNLSVVFPVKEIIAGRQRMLPMQIPVNVKQSSAEDLERQLKNTIKNPKKIDSTSIRWIRLLNETKSSRAKLYRLLHNSTLGKIADQYFKGDVLFSVMDAEEPTSSTTIVPQEKSLVCTVIRHPETKNVLSISLSGNEEFWSMEKLSYLVETLLKTSP